MTYNNPVLFKKISFCRIYILFKKKKKLKVMYISVISPVFNEEKNITLLYEHITASLKELNISNYEILFINDASTDKTFIKLKKICFDEHCKILHFSKNKGQTMAMQAGFIEAAGDIIITLDADLQNDPHDFGKLIAKLNEGFDLVCGWRKHRKDSFSKKLLSKLANALRKNLINDNIHDEGCTLRAYTKKAAKSLQLTKGQHRFIPTLLFLKGFRVGEIVTKHHDRQFGQTKYGISRLWVGFMDIYSIKLKSEKRSIKKIIQGTVLLQIMFMFSCCFLPLWYSIIFFSINIIIFFILAEIANRFANQKKNPSYKTITKHDIYKR